ncbi:hypothetical protein [Vibrio phage JSF23]|jgi:hypothetical protein|uniref:Major capsid protein n=5 Tax=root TaxID=1 RepID=A0A076G502_9CAUD|nr:hypothetical protein ViPhICP2p16 [Vibrio phage ICP2]ADX87769.1 hypothetical protein TU12-16_00075 [Vibrio phage ICP2_2006_A]AII27060.1 hypothetical protein ICP22011A_0016 [Vibrio phage ICP2_2011_A]ASV43783.1 hypothetical protein [Vibrio phage JSF23]ASV43809.1 hypothetical protein [Vibrio phage JSF27]QIG62486.1 hypothetical protein Saratov12_00037 [Vibrio phage Saratov-12]QNL29730.1 hypothetical protein Saratov15_00050 [Vibrio phage Saratov-15]WJJ54291.1 hypothetical protein [Vibrio phage 
MSGATGSQNTGNSRHFIEAQQYSKFILENLHDGFLPAMMYRNVSDFPAGEVLNIKTVGTVTIQDVEEETPLIYNPIETGNVQMRITDYKGDAWSVTDKLRQDGAQIETLMAMRAQESTRAMQEDFETRYLQVAYEGLTAADANEINGFAHKRIATGTNKTIELEDLIYLKLAADKANVPLGGRILIVDPIVEATLNTKFQITASAIDSNPFFMDVFKGGFARDHKFITNLYGWNIITSNRLPRIVSEQVGGVTITNGVACIGMCVADDNCKPVMYAERQAPRVESERNKDLARDEFVARRRYGLGIQRKDTLFALLASETAYK